MDVVVVDGYLTAMIMVFDGNYNSTSSYMIFVSAASITAKNGKILKEADIIVDCR